MHLPRYGDGSLAEVVPSLLAGFGVPGMANPLGLPPSRNVCLLLVDGLGWNLLQDFGDEAPFLSSLAAGSEPITAGFPATTATSIASLGTGLPAGEHGLVGYSFAVSDDELLNTLGWSSHGTAHPADLRERYVPEQIQPLRTVFERAADAGVPVRTVTAHDQKGSGLTRAALRGAEFRGTLALGDLVSAALEATRDGFCYAYHADLDKLGHVYGPGSEPWRMQLAYVDKLAEMIADRLPPGALLVITADHGMVAVGEQDRIDFDTEPVLQQGVHLLGGEARVRHVYTEYGATDDVLQTWQDMLGSRAWLVRRAEAIEAGWFGPHVAEHVRERIGDVVVAARGTTVVVRSLAERRLSRLVGQHGSLTEDEQLIPLLVHTGRRLASQ